MHTLSSKCEELTWIYIKSISNNIGAWGDELHSYLKKYGVRYKLCQQIARRRAMYAIDCIERGKRINIFYKISGTKQAVDIYNAYIRHEKTNYDFFCEQVSSCMCGGNSPLSGNDIKKLWRLQYPAQHDAYEKKCIFIDEKYRRVYNQHFKYL